MQLLCGLKSEVVGEGISHVIGRSVPENPSE
jgi:hypothetical protein